MFLWWLVWGCADPAAELCALHEECQSGMYADEGACWAEAEEADAFYAGGGEDCTAALGDYRACLAQEVRTCDALESADWTSLCTAQIQALAPACDELDEGLGR